MDIPLHIALEDEPPLSTSRRAAQVYLVVSFSVERTFMHLKGKFFIAYHVLSSPHMEDRPSLTTGRQACCSGARWVYPKLSIYVGLAKTIHMYVYMVYISILSREIAIHTVIYGVHIRFWPTLLICYFPPFSSSYFLYFLLFDTLTRAHPSDLTHSCTCNYSSSLHRKP
jgi:hypothetical protein